MPILISLRIWGPQLARRRDIFHCDNPGAFGVVQAPGSANAGVLCLMKKMVTAAASCNLALKIDSIALSLALFRVSRLNDFKGTEVAPESTGITNEGLLRGVV